jgi:hypothetical protein
LTGRTIPALMQRQQLSRMAVGLFIVLTVIAVSTEAIR